MPVDAEERLSDVTALNGLRVLVVEDNWHLAGALKAILQQMGMAVAKPAATIADAESLLAQDAFDLVVTDINLKGELTFDLIDRLRARGIRVLAITGYSDLPSSSKKPPALLQKPFTKSELLAALHQAIDPC